MSKEELTKKIEVVEKELRSYTWRELETNSKFAKNDKLSFITDDVLIVGCDIGSENHYIRAIDVRGRELSRGAFEFSNTSEGFENAKAWVLALAVKHDKKQIVLGLEPTGHYWFALAAWMISDGISVVQVNTYAVKQSKEIEDNSQLKDDRKDPKLIANLVKDGNYGMPYLPEKILEIKGVGENILAGILAEMGDISRFDDVKKIQKLSGMGLVACSSGKHKGQAKISHRGRKRLRYWLFQAAKSAVSHADEFKQLHEYYTTRTNNPLKKMQSLVVIACKILRVIYTILKTGATYDPQKLLKDIKHPAASQAPMAA